MAAKKRNKRKSQIALIFKTSAVLFAIATFVMAFFSNVEVVGKITHSTWGEFTGIQMMFGYAEKTGDVSLKILDFNILIAIGYLLPIFAMVIMVLGKNEKVPTLICMLAMVAAGVMILFNGSFVANSLSEGSTVTETFFVFQLTIGGILSSAFAFVSGICFGATLVLTK